LVDKRKIYERNIITIWEEKGTLDQEKDAWLKYINYEIE